MNKLSRITIERPRRTARQPGLKMGGRVQIAVLDTNGAEVSRTPWIRNLILDQGLDALADTLIADLFKYCAVGTGSDAVKRNGTGTITIANGSTTIVGTGSDFTGDDVGRLVRMTGGADSGFEAKIVSVASVTSAEIEEPTTQEISSGSYDVYYVNRTGLTTEEVRSGDYSFGSGENGTTTSTDTKTLTRTFLFPAEEANISYSEIGWSHESDPGNNLNILIDLTGSEIDVNEGQRLKVTYEFNVTVSPATTQSGTVEVTDSDLMSVNKSASWVIEKFAISVVNLSGETDDSNIELEPSYEGFAAFSSDTTALVALTGVNQRLTNISVVGLSFEDDYVAGSFERIFTGVFDLEDANRSDLRSLMIHSGAGGFAIFTILFNNNQTKTNNHSFTTRWKKSWGRDLS